MNGTNVADDVTHAAVHLFARGPADKTLVAEQITDLFLTGIRSRDA